MNIMRNRTKFFIAGLAAGTLGVLFGLVGNADYADEKKETAHYCEMVRGGHWPDYRGWFDRYCGEAMPVLKPSQSARKRSA